MLEKVNKHYFAEKEEKAVVRFNNSNCNKERNEIYNEFLRAPMDKMVESIINRYGLFRKGVTFKEIHSDALADLIMKANKFKEDKNKKAYSYYGTICRNYLRAVIKKDREDLLKHYEFDAVTTQIEENENYQYSIEDDSINVSSLIKNLIDEINKIISDNESGFLKKKLNDNELKLGYALIDILSQPTLYFNDGFETPKYNKNTVLLVIREYTGLSTKDIRIALQRYKVLYKFIQNEMINDGSIE